MKANRIKVEVNKQDIRLGKRCIPESCAVARAASRAFGVPMKSGKVQAGLTSIMFDGRWFSMSAKGQKFITDLDNRRKVKPITFYATEYCL